MFLEPGEPRRVLAKKVQYLLLLALRIGVLGAAGARVRRARDLAHAASRRNADGARLHLIVLDGSASMSYGDRWDRARAAANDVLDSMSGDDRAQIVLAGRLFEVLGPATGDVAALRQTLEHGRARRVPPRVRPADALDRRLAAHGRAARRPRPRHRRAEERPADALRRARAAPAGRDRDSRRHGRRGRELDGRQLRRLGADRRADGERAQLCARRRHADADADAERPHRRRADRRDPGRRPRAGDVRGARARERRESRRGRARAGRRSRRRRSPLSRHQAPGAAQGADRGARRGGPRRACSRARRSRR